MTNIVSAQLELAKPISCTFDLIKSATEVNGARLFHGPAALVDAVDLDREMMVKSAVNDGLNTFMRLGGHVDWDHLYKTSHQPIHIIGKCIEKSANPKGGADIITTRLKRNNPFANQAWDHYHDPDAPGVLAYSLQGMARARDPLNKAAVTALDVFMMTLTPIAKGFEGPRVTAGPAPTFGGLLKSFCDELAKGVYDEWQEVDLGFAAKPTFYSFPPGAAQDDDGVVEKAMLTGDGVVLPGDQGARALRKQSLDRKLASTPKLAGPAPGKKCQCKDGEGECRCDDVDAEDAEDDDGHKYNDGPKKPVRASAIEKSLTAQAQRLGLNNPEAIARAGARMIAGRG